MNTEIDVHGVRPNVSDLASIPKITPTFNYQSELPRQIQHNSVESDNVTLTLLNVTLTLYNVTLTSQKLYKHISL